MGKSRLDNGRDIWKRLDKEDFDDSFSDFNSSSIYKPKKLKEAEIYKLYDNVTKKRNEKLKKPIIILTLMTISLIVLIILIRGR